MLMAHFLMSPFKKKVNSFQKLFILAESSIDDILLPLQLTLNRFLNAS